MGRKGPWALSALLGVLGVLALVCVEVWRGEDGPAGSSEGEGLGVRGGEDQGGWGVLCRNPALGVCRGSQDRGQDNIQSAAGCGWHQPHLRPLGSRV